METIPPLETRSFDVPHPSRSRSPLERADAGEVSPSRSGGRERGIVGLVSGRKTRQEQSSSTRSERDHPIRDRWRAFIQRHLDGSVGRLRAGRLARWCGHPSSASLDRSACGAMTERCREMGFQVEPDPHVLPLTWEPDDELALVPRDDSQVRSPPPAFEVAALAVSMGLYVAAPGGDLDEPTRRSLVETLETSIDVSPHDHRRLRALADVLDSDRIEDSIDRCLDAFRTSVEDTTRIPLLVDIASSIGPRVPESSKRLGRIARELGITPDDVVSHVRRSLEEHATRSESQTGRSARPMESFLSPLLRDSERAHAQESEERQQLTGEDDGAPEVGESPSSDDEERLRHLFEQRVERDEEPHPLDRRYDTPTTNSVE